MSQFSDQFVPMAFFDPQTIDYPSIFVPGCDRVDKVLLFSFDQRQFPLDGRPTIELGPLSGSMFLKGFVDSDLIISSVKASSSDLRTT